MKKLIIFNLFFAIALLIGCKKEDGFLPKEVVVDRVPQPSVVKNGGSANIDLTNLNSFAGKFDVSLLYPSDVPPTKMDIVVRKNNAGVKTYKADVTAFPSTFTITAAEIATLFGTAIVIGDNYDVGVDIYTQNGKKYEAFPAVGAAYGNTGVANQPNFSPTVRYSAVCAYNAALFGTGNYIVLQDDWADYSVGDVVVLTQIDANRISFKYSAAAAQPIIITINPTTNVTSVASQVYGNYGPPYGDFTAASVANNAANVVLPCAKEIGVRLSHTSGGLNFGDHTIRFRKQ